MTAKIINLAEKRRERAKHSTEQPFWSIYWMPLIYWANIIGALK